MVKLRLMGEDPVALLSVAALARSSIAVSQTLAVLMAISMVVFEAAAPETAVAASNINVNQRIARVVGPVAPDKIIEGEICGKWQDQGGYMYLDEGVPPKPIEKSAFCDCCAPRCAGSAALDALNPIFRVLKIAFLCHNSGADCGANPACFGPMRRPVVVAWV